MIIGTLMEDEPRPEIGAILAAILGVSDKLVEILNKPGKDLAAIVKLLQEDKHDH